MAAATAAIPEIAVTPAPALKPVAVPSASLELKVLRGDLVRALTAACVVSERRTTIPILSHLRIEAQGSSLSIIATDMQQTISLDCPAKVSRAGRCTVPARRFMDYIRALPEGELTIKQLENDWVQIRSGRSNTKMAGMDAKGFPQVPIVEATRVKISGNLLTNAITRTIDAVTQDENRYTLRGALLTVDSSSLRMVSTDGHRLAMVYIAGQFGNVNMRTIVPRDSMVSISTLVRLAGVDELELGLTDTYLSLRIGGWMYTSTLLGGVFPAYEKVIPQNNPLFCDVPLGPLADAVSRVEQFADARSHSVKLLLSKGQVTLSAQSSDNGESTETIDAAYEGPDAIISLNSEYLLEALAAAGRVSTVRITMKDKVSPLLLIPATESGTEGLLFQTVIMPMRG